MKPHKFLSIILLIVCISANAQTVFHKTVSIEFEKRVAVWPMMKEMESEWFEQEKNNFPKEVLSYFNFSSNGNQSIYKRTKEAELPRNSYFRPIADENIIYNDYTNGTTVSLKPVFEENFLVTDSFHKIKWKITSDTRNIAGFECRKAVGILFDTVAVFAFYTDEIMVSGGPESITGLPGMILGVGIPKTFTTWFATQVSLQPNLKSIVPPGKGKKSTRQEMFSKINQLAKRWGSEGAFLSMIYSL